MYRKIKNYQKKLEECYARSNDEVDNKVDEVLNIVRELKKLSFYKPKNLFDIYIEDTKSISYLKERKSSRVDDIKDFDKKYYLFDGNNYHNLNSNTFNKLVDKASRELSKDINNSLER